MHSHKIGTGRTLLLTAALLAAVACNGWAKIIYVDDDADGPGDGSSWQSAYKYLQNTLADANSADKPVEIRVAQGVYRPDRSAASPEGSRDREATFRMLSGVTLKGGYAGLKAPNPNARDTELYATTLSGDLAGNDVLSEDPCDFVLTPKGETQWCLVYEFTRRENSFHVVTTSGVDQSAVLDGLTITAGNASEPPFWFGYDGPIIFTADDEGAGLLNDKGSPTIRACAFTANSSWGAGAAMYNTRVCTPALTDCRFLGNFTLKWGGIVCSGDAGGRGSGVRLQMTRCIFRDNASRGSYGGAVLHYYGTVTAAGCEFTANHALTGPGVAVWRATGELRDCLFRNNGGGAIYSSDGWVVLTDCNFEGNSGGRALDLNSGTTTVVGCSFLQNKGGAISGGSGKLKIDNCLFEGNLATSYGGAIYNTGSGAIVTNCTFSGNKAALGATLAVYSKDALVLRNCILWDNEVAAERAIHLIDYAFPSAVNMSYSLLRGGQANISTGPRGTIVWGPGNIDADPCFAEPGYWDNGGTPQDANDDFFVAGDYHLKSQAGRWDPANSKWVMDEATSPCIDAGNPGQQVGLEPLPNGSRINMGAYGGTAEASKSYFGGPVCEMQIPGDINGDCRVDAEDLAMLARNWLRDERPRPMPPSSEVPSKPLRR